MKAKAYLEQIRKYETLIDNKTTLIRRLREQAISITAPSDKERVQSSGMPDRMGEAVARIVDLENRVKSDVEKLVSIKNDVMSTIDELSNSDMINLLYKKYVLLKTWEQIPDEMGYTARTVYRIHGSALQEVQKILDRRKVVSKCH